MSGRPANPSYTPLVWDSGNYAAGSNPWSGTAKRVDPGYRFWTPVLKAAGQFFNFVFGSIFDVQNSQKTDATNVLALVGQSPAMTWFPGVTTDATKALSRGVFSVKEQAWYAVGNGGNDWGMVSYDFGRSWTALTLGSSLALLDAAADAAGNVVLIATSTRDMYYGAFSAYGTVGFTHEATALSATVNNGSVTYDTTHSKWIACYRTGSSGLRVDTSTNGTTWTAQTVPAGWSGYTGSAAAPQIHSSSNGTTIASFYDNVNTKERIMRSTDGGTTWTEIYATTPGVTPTNACIPTRDTVNGIWYLTLATTGAGRSTQILKSVDDGVTWTTAVTLSANDASFYSVAALGTMVSAVDDIGRTFYSLDGISWMFVARNALTTSATIPFIRAGGGGMMIFAAAQKLSYASTRYTSDGQAV